MRPAGPVIRIFSPLNTGRTPLVSRRCDSERIVSQAPRTAQTTDVPSRASHVRVTSEASDTMTPAGDGDGTLERAILLALDGLLDALELERVEQADRFRVVGEPGRFDRVFGGQTVAQALLAASATVSGKLPHSLHAYFVEAGTPEAPLDLVVDRVRDGRSSPPDA